MQLIISFVTCQIIYLIKWARAGIFSAGDSLGNGSRIVSTKIIHLQLRLRHTTKERVLYTVMRISNNFNTVSCGLAKKGLNGFRIILFNFTYPDYFFPDFGPKDSTVLQ
jgi:hypothetical protein